MRLNKEAKLKEAKLKGNKKIGLNLHKFGKEELKSKPVYRKDTGTVVMQPYTTPERNPFPFKPTPQMIAEHQVEIARAYNALREAEYITNYKKQRSQFFSEKF